MVFSEIAMQAWALLLLLFSKEQQDGFRTASLRQAWKRESFHF